MKSSSGPARTQSAGQSAFKGQLQDAIQERKSGSGAKDTKKDTKQGAAGEGDKPETAKKKDALPPQPVAVAVLQPTLPPPPPLGAFGLPTAGVEARSDTEGASNKADAVEPASIGKPAPDASTIAPPAPPAETAQPDSKAGLAFALRLADLTPNREVVLAPAAQQPASALQPDLALPVSAPQAAPIPAATPQRPADSAIAAAIKTTQPAPQPAAAATPVIAITPREGASAQSGSHSSDGGAAGKETPKQVQQPQPAADPKSFRQASATSEAVSSVSRETPLQTPAAALTAATPAPLATPAPPAPQPSTSVTAAPSVERVSIPLAAPNPAAHVTDVSVNLQVPRADASGDDRIAIRMLQVGSEIHVSVRTPDSQLAQSLRQDLGKLTSGLDQGGFRTETWRPVAANAAAQANTNPQHQPSQGNPNRDAAGSGGRSAGNGGQSAGEQKRKQQDERPRWVAELEQQRNH
jgi:hypothetical protein